MSFALDGVRVLELARFQAGPRGGMILSDLGAEVIKIEPPGGEETRRHPPMVRGQSVYFTVYNRGKKSVCLDLRSDARARRSSPPSSRRSDIVLENFRPGVMRAMGFDYDRLRALNPGIILVSVSGFGQYGPYRDRPAFDPLGQAMSGLMTLDGPAGGPAARHGVLRGRPLHRAPRHDRHAGRAAPPRAHRRGTARRRVPARLGAHHGRDPDLVLPRDRRGGRGGRPAAVPRQGRLGRHQRGRARDGGAADGVVGAAQADDTPLPGSSPARTAARAFVERGAPSTPSTRSAPP